MATRTNQRARTRQALVDAAGALVDAGNSTPSMDEVAAEALVSRATAYRYFDSVEDIIWTLGADREVTLLQDPFAGCNSVVERVLVAEAVNNDFLFADTDSTRAFERAALDRRLNGRGKPDDRPARRLRFIDRALEPVADRLDDETLRRLRYSLALAIGTQTVPALLDTCGLEVDEARATTRFATEVLVTHVLTAAGIDPHAPLHVGV